MHLIASSAVNLPITGARLRIAQTQPLWVSPFPESQACVTHVTVDRKVTCDHDTSMIS